MTRAQSVGALREQRDDGKIATERCEIPRTIDVRDRLEQPDGADAENDGYDEVRNGASPRSEATCRKAPGPDRNRRDHDAANRPLAAGVQDAFDPPVVRSDPCRARRIEEDRRRDPNICSCEREERRRRRESQQGPAHFTPPQAVIP